MVGKLNMTVELYTLRIFNDGCDPTNYRILKMLPSDFKTISKNIGIKKMATARRLNILLKYSLLTWEKRKGRIEPTHLSEELIKIIETIKKGIKLKLPEILPLILEK